MRWKSSAVRSSSLSWATCLVVPALLTSASSRPQGAAAAAIFLQSSSRETSPCTTMTSLAPALRQVSGVPSPSFLFLEWLTTMRAPPLARIPDVAAPRPDAEPVTITHKPSLDIPFPLVVLSLEIRSRLYHTAQRNAKLHCAELRHASPAKGPDIHACQ